MFCVSFYVASCISVCLGIFPQIACTSSNLWRTISRTWQETYGSFSPIVPIMSCSNLTFVKIVCTVKRSGGRQLVRLICQLINAFKMFGAAMASCNCANNLLIYFSVSFSVLATLHQSSVMAELYIKELEGKVAYYEAIMRMCLQCKSSLPTFDEADSSKSSPHQSRSTRSVQQPNAELPPPGRTVPLERPPQASNISSSARSSKQLQILSRTEPQPNDVQQSTSSLPPAARSSRSNQSAKARTSSLRHPPANPSNPPTTRSATSSGTKPSRQPPTSSQNPPSRPFAPGLDNSDGRRPYTGSVVALDLQLNKKSKSSTQSGRPPGESPRSDQWLRPAELMLEEVPSGRYWQQKLSRMDSSIIAAVAIGIVPVPDQNVPRAEDADHKKLIQLVRIFAERHSARRIDFQQFILVCLCKVLSSQGVPKRKIVEALQICISDTRKENIDRYLRGAFWVNQMMDNLFFTDWGYRAVDLIVICMILKAFCWKFC